MTEVVTELLEKGTATHAFFGIRPAPLTPQIARQLAVEPRQGVVLDVVSGGPAAGAGIRAGDVIVAVEGERIESVEAFLGALRQREPGDEVSVRLARGGQEQTVGVRLAERPPSTVRP